MLAKLKRIQLNDKYIPVTIATNQRKLSGILVCIKVPVTFCRPCLKTYNSYALVCKFLALDKKFKCIYYSNKELNGKDFELHTRGLYHSLLNLLNGMSSVTSFCGRKLDGKQVHGQ